MQKKIFVAALLLATARIPVSFAAPVGPPIAPADRPSGLNEARPVQLAHDFFDSWRGERHRHDDDDDQDEGRGRSHGHHHGDHHGDRERVGDRPADPNAANAPVPNNGVFNGKARPKVEVQ